MNVLFIAPRCDDGAGDGVYVSQLAAALSRSEVAVSVLTLRERGLPRPRLISTWKSIPLPKLGESPATSPQELAVSAGCLRIRVARHWRANSRNRFRGKEWVSMQDN